MRTPSISVVVDGVRGLSTLPSYVPQGESLVPVVFCPDQFS